MKQKIGKKGIERKLLKKVTLIFFVSYLVFSAASFYMLYTTLSKQIITDNKRVLGTVETQLSGILSTCRQTENQIVSNEELGQKMRKVEGADYPYVAAYHAAQDLLSYVRTSPYLGSMAVMFPERSFHSAGVGYEALTDSFREAAWFQDFSAGTAQSTLSPVYEDTNGRSFRCFSYVARYRDLFSPQKEECFLFMMIPLDRVRSLLGGQDVLITNRWGEPVCASDSIDAGQMKGLHFTDGMCRMDGYYVFRGQAWEDGLQIYLPVPENIFYGGMVGSLVLLFLLLLFCLGGMVLLLSLTIKKMLKPVYTLRNVMALSASGRFDVRAQVKSGDEFEYLAGGYNDLIDRLQSYINQLRENEAIRSQMQNDLLMSQIHPHFIYNTLNSAVYLVEDGQNDEAIKVIDALIAMLQNTVKLGEKEIFTTVAEELEFLDAYLCIQQLRYPGRYVCHVRCEEAMRRQFLPRVSIQPLVENALFHGILPLERPGRIEVNIFKDPQGRLVVRVEDDGVGIPPERLEGILERPSEKGHGIGLENIRNRLRFLFGDLPAGIEVKSQPGKGTEVTLYIPIDG